jgi:hypothetical protein
MAIAENHSLLDRMVSKQSVARFKHSIAHNFISLSSLEEIGRGGKNKKKIKTNHRYKFIYRSIAVFSKLQRIYY